MANKQLYLLPGFHGSATLFDELLQHLPNNITPYPLGYDSADSLDEHLENISPQLPESGAFLLAESFSGLIALALMARQPTRFRAAVLSCSFAVSPMMPLAKLGAKLPAIAFQQTPIKHYILNHFCLNWQKIFRFSAALDIVDRERIIIARLNKRPALVERPCRQHNESRFREPYLDSFRR